MEKEIKKLKHYVAFIKYKDMKIQPMPVGGYDEESVIKKITDFYMDFFNEKEMIIEIKLKEITKNEK